MKSFVCVCLKSNYRFVSRTPTIVKPLFHSFEEIRVYFIRQWNRKKEERNMWETSLSIEKKKKKIVIYFHGRKLLPVVARRSLYLPIACVLVSRHDSTLVAISFHTSVPGKRTTFGNLILLSRFVAAEFCRFRRTISNSVGRRRDHCDSFYLDDKLDNSPLSLPRVLREPVVSRRSCCNFRARGKFICETGIGSFRF